MIVIIVGDDTTGRAVKGAKVCIGFDGLRGMTNTLITDKEGKVNFSHPSGSGRIFVNGRKVYSGKIRGSVTVFK